MYTCFYQLYLYSANIVLRLLILYMNHNFVIFYKICLYFKGFKIKKLLVAQVHVVVEAVLDGRTVAEASTVGELHGLAHQVSSRVPEHVLALLVVELQQLEVAVALQRSVQVP